MLPIPDVIVKFENDEPRNLTEDAKILPHEINQGFMNQAALYAYYSAKYASARGAVDIAKLQVKIQEDLIDKEIFPTLSMKARHEFELENIRATEGKIASRIFTYPEYKEAQNTLNQFRVGLVQAQKNLAVLEAAKDVISQKKDMLISLGAQIRAEGGNQELILREKTFQAINS